MYRSIRRSLLLLIAGTTAAFADPTAPPNASAPARRPIPPASTSPDPASPTTSAPNPAPTTSRTTAPPNDPAQTTLPTSGSSPSPSSRYSVPTTLPPTSSYPPPTTYSQSYPPATVVAAEPSPITGSPNGAPLPAPVDPVDTLANERARFSGKRLALEIIGGGLIGGVTSALVFNATCNGRDCLGASLLSFGADFAVTPLAVYEIGHLMGGRGSLLYSYLAAGPALTPFSMTGAPDETPDQTLSRLELEVTLSTIFLPICSAVLYEATSHFSYLRWQREHGASIALTPVHGSGAMGVVSLSF